MENWFKELKRETRNRRGQIARKYPLCNDCVSVKHVVSDYRVFKKNVRDRRKGQVRMRLRAAGFLKVSPRNPYELKTAGPSPPPGTRRAGVGERSGET